MYKKVTIFISTVLLIIAFVTIRHMTLLGSILFIVGILGNIFSIFFLDKGKEKDVDIVYTKIKNKDLLVDNIVKKLEKENEKLYYLFDEFTKVIRDFRTSIEEMINLSKVVKQTANESSLLSQNLIDINNFIVEGAQKQAMDAANLKDYIVVDPVDEVRIAVAQLKGKVDVIVGAFHMGLEQEYDTYGSGVLDILKITPDLDVVILGHAHQKIAEMYYYNGKIYRAINGKIFDERENDITQEVKLNGTLLVEPASRGGVVSQVVLELEKKDDKFEIVDKRSANHDVKTSSGYVQPDKELTRKLKPFHYKALDYANEEIGFLVGGPLVPEDEIKGIPQVWIQPTALLDLINSVQMYFGEQVIDRKIDVSAAAAFREDANIKEGPIKRSDISLIYKYDNTLYVLEVTGSQLKKYMEWSVSFYNQYQPNDLTISFNSRIPGYNYDIFKGVYYEIDISKPVGERIINLRRSDGTPIKDDDVLTLTVNNYRANTQLLTYGPVFKEGEPLPKLLGRTEDHPDFSAISGGDLRKLIEKYIIEVKNGVLTPDYEENWKIIGNYWDEELHNLVKELSNEGIIEVNKYKPVRVEDIQSFIKAY
jgi:2',3'-cyclic-nucleotide 2'-phosphodiesterase (5'-nucleotidase family)